MPSARNIKLVEELKERLSRCTIAVAADFTGVPVGDMNRLRRMLKEQGAEVRVVKNRLTYIAAEAVGKPGLREVVQGPTLLVFGYDDPVVVARALADLLRGGEIGITVRGAVLDGQVLTPQQVSQLATLPPKEQLLAQLMGQLQNPVAVLISHLQAPVAQLVGLLNNTVSALATLLQRRAEQLQGQQ